MAKLDTLETSKTSRVIVYGGPKVGKTQLVGDLSKNYNLLWFDLENGKDTLFKLPKEQQARIEIVSLPDTKDYPIAIETMLKVIKGTRTEICDKHGKVACTVCKKSVSPFTVVELSAIKNDTIVVIDSLTQLSNSCMAHITKNNSDELAKIEWDEYNKQGMLLDKILSNIQQATYNIVVISHETESTFEDGRKKLVPVAGTANFSRNTAKYFDHVVYTEVKNKKHNFASSSTYSNGLVTGSRTGVAIEDMKAPSLDGIFTYTLGDVVEDQAKVSTDAEIVITQLRVQAEVAQGALEETVPTVPVITSPVETPTPTPTPTAKLNALDQMKARLAAQKAKQPI